MKNLLVAVDLKSSDSLLLDQAILLAEKFKSKIWVIHFASPDPDFVGFELGPRYIREFRAEELRAEHKLIQTYTDDLAGRGLDADGLLIQGPTIEMIHAEVEKLGIDLLIIGSHKHGFLYETFVGHTAAKMIGDIAIPLLIVPLPHES